MVGDIARHSTGEKVKISCFQEEVYIVTNSIGECVYASGEELETISKEELDAEIEEKAKAYCDGDVGEVSSIKPLCRVQTNGAQNFEQKRLMARITVSLAQQSINQSSRDLK